MKGFYQNRLDQDPRPRNLAPWVARFRKVEPVDLLANAQVSFRGVKSYPRSARTQSGLNHYQGAWELPQITHLLRRSLFGIKKSELDTFKNLTLSQSLDLLLTPSPVPDPPINLYNSAAEGIEDPTVPQGETWIHAPYNNEYEGPRITSLKSWLIKNIINQEATLSEKMLLFWHNLLATQSWGIFIAKTSYNISSYLGEIPLAISEL